MINGAEVWKAINENDENDICLRKLFMSNGGYGILNIS